MNWLHYLLEANIYLAVFYAGYCLFLNRETYYTLNRVYLLLTCFISFLLPLIQIGMLKPAEQGITTTVYIVQTHLKPSVNQATSVFISPQDILFYTYCLGVIVLVIILIFKLYKLVQMTRTANKMADDKYKIVPLEGSNTAFSFFNYLFIGSKTTGNNIIIRHEMVHIRQKHTLDVLFLEVIKIINWFNPLIYLLQNSLKTVHEYIADEQTAAFESDRLSYSSFLVNNAYGLHGSSVTHSFFNYNLLKKRIIMLNQKRSGNLARLKYLVAVPICAAALCASTLGFSKTYALVDLAPNHNNTAAAYKTANIAPETTKRDQTDTTRIVKPNQVTSKGYKYDEDGYLVNGKTDFRVIITEKNGEQKAYFKHSAKPADLALLKNKYGYSFPKMLIHPKMPPPPPVPPAPSANAPQPKAITKRPPPPPPAAPKTVSNKPSKITDVQLMPPPPPPRDPFDSLYQYIARHVRYPTVAHDNRIGGRVIVVVTINNGKIEDVKLTRSLTDETDAEVIRVLKNYNGPLGIKSGYYSLPVAFSLLDEHNNQVAHAPENYTPKKADYVDKDYSPKYSMNQVVVTGYVTTKQ